MRFMPESSASSSSATPSAALPSIDPRAANSLTAREKQALHNHHPDTKFCSACAHPLVTRVPDGDARMRLVCDHCRAIHYKNPKIVVGAIAAWEDGRILLCKRAIDPRYGFWTLPAGFMENAESTAEGAARETMEEAGARIAPIAPFSMVEVPYVNQVHVFYRATLLHLDFAAGEESLEAHLFAPADIPWDDLAFPTVKTTLKRYVEDLAKGAFGFHTKILVYTPK
jgi:ADP-ribose pyrophosphatase YjhB (NUDIX family)